MTNDVYNPFEFPESGYPSYFSINEMDICSEDVYKNIQGTYVVWYRFKENCYNSIFFNTRNDSWEIIGISHNSIMKNMKKLSGEERILFDKKKLVKKLQS
jgi:hypothetical protein